MVYTPPTAIARSYVGKGHCEIFAEEASGVDLPASQPASQLVSDECGNDYPLPYLNFYSHKRCSKLQLLATRLCPQAFKSCHLDGGTQLTFAPGASYKPLQKGQGLMRSGNGTVTPKSYFLPCKKGINLLNVQDLSTCKHSQVLRFHDHHNKLDVTKLCPLKCDSFPQRI